MKESCEEGMASRARAENSRHPGATSFADHETIAASHLADGNNSLLVWGKKHAAAKASMYPRWTLNSIYVMLFESLCRRTAAVLETSVA